MALMLRGDGVAFGAQNKVVSSTTVDVIDDQGFVIGFVTEMRETDSRPVQRVRHLSSSDAGRTIEMVPNVETISITVNGYSLYDKSQTNRKSLVGRMGSSLSALKSLVSQREPFHLIQKETHPSTGEVSEHRYYMCWFTNATRSRAINTIAAVDSATVEVGQKE